MNKSRGGIQRTQLFNDYSANFTAVQRDLAGHNIQDTFLCPLCLKAFGRDALEKPERLSVEHCIPGRVGGTLATATMTCTDCNNGMGSQLDAQWKRRAEVLGFLTGKSARPTDCVLTVGGIKVRGEWSLSIDGLPKSDITLDAKRSNPKDMQAVQAAMQKLLRDPENAKFTLSFPWFKERHSRVALLRMAFLMMFRQFGYSYILLPCMERVRRQILNPKDKTIPDAYIMQIDELRAANKVTVITAPTDHRSFMVILKFSTDGQTFCKGVIMPAPDDNQSTIYETLAEEQSQKDKFTPTVSILRYDPSWLSVADCTSYLSTLWSEILQKQ